MTLTFTETSISTANAPSMDAFDLKNAEFNASPGQFFGQVMSDLLQSQADSTNRPADPAIGAQMAEGQMLADLTGSEFGLSPSDASQTLQAIHLGPHLNLITPETPAPDPQSLEAFALAQGLDEKAVQWLLGTDARQTGSPAAPHWAPATTAAAAGLGTTAQTPGLTEPSFFAKSQPAATLPMTGPLIADMAKINALDPTTTTTTATGMGTALPGSGLASSQTQPAPALSVLAGLAQWGGIGHTKDTPKALRPSSDAATPDDAATLALMRMPPPAAVWMQRANLNGVLQDMATAKTNTDISTSELDLGGEWTAQLQLLMPETQTGTSATATGTQGAAYANFAARWDAQAAPRSDLNPAQATPGLDPAQRSDDIQNLAEKMGQAVGQRILSEMEKGQWHLKLTLRPATLGHIEVEMRMRSGEFDAVFTAPNGTTRDLLQDGMAKLKETLSQMGMDVASVHVGDGKTGQNGGDPTPGSFRERPSTTQTNTSETATDMPHAPRTPSTSDGLDVLV